ncbi:hypothetical protein HNQ59_002286 [Chitinivorax tropicus]|uniref:Uncharacterized protein n=1 Tax=Chitinivorax tropicus TaxID=714531 RepID=A0A840MK12_9PROT|nr:hypothetical protein [Chitinivorax tropicus]MBB5018988.1 hypothetical protein [Chitinivorax tropicus]
MDVTHYLQRPGCDLRCGYKKSTNLDDQSGHGEAVGVTELLCHCYIFVIVILSWRLHLRGGTGDNGMRFITAIANNTWRAVIKAQLQMIIRKKCGLATVFFLWISEVIYSEV